MVHISWQIHRGLEHNITWCCFTDRHHWRKSWCEAGYLHQKSQNPNPFLYIFFSVSFLSWASHSSPIQGLPSPWFVLGHDHHNTNQWIYSRDSPPLATSDTTQGYKQLKAKLGRKHVRTWRWVSFTNPARTDGAVLHHWRRTTDEAKEYPFARFNKVQIQWITIMDMFKLPLSVLQIFNHVFRKLMFPRTPMKNIRYCAICSAFSMDYIHASMHYELVKMTMCLPYRCIFMMGLLLPGLNKKQIIYLTCAGTIPSCYTLLLPVQPTSF